MEVMGWKGPKARSHPKGSTKSELAKGGGGGGDERVDAVPVRRTIRPTREFLTEFRLFIKMMNVFFRANR
jgi:hypothetical protein